MAETEGTEEGSHTLWSGPHHVLERRLNSQQLIGKLVLAGIRRGGSYKEDLPSSFYCLSHPAEEQWRQFPSWSLLIYRK